MDYCSTCRRHLNGALVCPGCGAYAPDIAPHGVTGGYAARLPASPAAPDPSTAPVTTSGARARAGATDTAELPAAGAALATLAPSGRAARRRQRVRWKKTQRRALVATAVALVGGGLTLASMDRGTGDRAQAANSPMGGVEGPVDPASPAPDGTPPSSEERSARSPSTEDTRRRTDSAAPTRSTPSGTRTAAETTARTPVTAQQRTTSPDSGPGAPSGSEDRSGTGGSGTAARPTAAPPAASGNGGSSGGGNDGEDQGGSGTGGSTPSATSPQQPQSPDSPDAPDSSSQLCLLVVCLG